LLLYLDPKDWDKFFGTGTEKTSGEVVKENIKKGISTANVDILNPTKIVEKSKEAEIVKNESVHYHWWSTTHLGLSPGKRNPKHPTFNLILLRGLSSCPPRRF
jgi:alkyl sulfatase BDS1-like metallo-beta-lactamase superfamily hydrolase